MSAETLNAIEDAIQAHISDEAEQTTLVTGWLISFASVGPDASVASLGYLDSDLPMHEAWGLAKFADKFLDEHHEASSQDD